MTNKELIEPYEENERNLAEQVYKTFKIEHFNYSNPDSRRPWDTSYKIKEKDPSIFVEIKVRSFKIDRYEDFILEKAKLNSLIKLYNQGFAPEYWNFFLADDNTYDLIIFKLNKRILKWGQDEIPFESKRMNYQTFTGQENKIMKEIVMLRYEKGLDAKFTGQGWKITSKTA